MKRLPTAVATGPSILPTINQRRLMRDLNAIGRIGIGDRGAVTRLVFSVKELRSRQVLIHLMRQAGLKIHIDAIGNIFGRYDGADAKAPAVLAGSHLDTVDPWRQVRWAGRRYRLSGSGAHYQRK